MSRAVLVMVAGAVVVVQVIGTVLGLAAVLSAVIYATLLVVVVVAVVLICNFGPAGSQIAGSAKT